MLLALNDNAPPAHETTAIELEVYVGGGSVVDRAVIPYSKRWVERSGPLRCHRLWGRGCSD